LAAARQDRLRKDPEYRAHTRRLQVLRYHRRRNEGRSVFKIAPASVYEDLFASQAGCCAICRQPETAKDPTGRTKRLAIDHDATTGAIRGLLCARCNTAIGLLQHDLVRLARARQYLEAHVAPESLAEHVRLLNRKETAE
jgi:hypothetical protein